MFKKIFSRKKRFAFSIQVRKEEEGLFFCTSSLWVGYGCDFNDAKNIAVKEVLSQEGYEGFYVQSAAGKEI